MFTDLLQYSHRSAYLILCKDGKVCMCICIYMCVCAHMCVAAEQTLFVHFGPSIPPLSYTPAYVHFVASASESRSVEVSELTPRKCRRWMSFNSAIKDSIPLPEPSKAAAISHWLCVIKAYFRDLIRHQWISGWHIPRSDPWQINISEVSQRNVDIVVGQNTRARPGDSLCLISNPSLVLWTKLWNN